MRAAIHAGAVAVAVAIALAWTTGASAAQPSAADYATMTVKDIVVVDLDGNIVKGRWKPTIETPMHVGFYRRRSEVGAVVHCHAPQVSGFAAALRPIPLVLAEAAACVGGEVPVAPFMPSDAGVSTRCAPSALSSVRRSTDMLSGIVSVSE